MKLFIYNIPNQNCFEEENFNPPNLIWKGQNWQQFFSDSGLDGSCFGGLYLDEKGKICFSLKQKREFEDQFKSVMTGSILVSFLRNRFGSLSISSRSALLTPLIIVFDVIEKDTNFTEVEFAESVEIIKSLAEQTGVLSLSEINSLHNELINWAKGFKFATEEI